MGYRITDNKRISNYYKRQKLYRKAKFAKRNWQARVISTTVISEPSFKEKYHNFLKSPFWANQKREILKWHRSCQICNSETDLQVHHITYRHVFDSNPAVDSPEDFAVICRYHHDEFHTLYGLAHDMTQNWSDYLIRKR
jgi:5-methylcytosine-specific restriction endonuclease McrA